MKYVELLKEDRIAKVILNRPDIHNAFDEVMISELIDVFDEIAGDKKIRIVIITGAGRSFCAGADLSWMKKMKDYSYEENIKDSNQLTEMVFKAYSMPKPTIARVNGAVIGGGMGLVAASDYVIASEKAIFKLSEVSIGLAPAVISPYLLMKMGRGVCSEIFLTAKKFDAIQAKEFGLVNDVVAHDELDEAVENMIDIFLKNSPQALKASKDLVQSVPLMDLESAKKYTADVIAKLRISEEGQEGIASFFEKRKPNW